MSRERSHAFTTTAKPRSTPRVDVLREAGGVRAAAGECLMQRRCATATTTLLFFGVAVG